MIAIVIVLMSIPPFEVCAVQEEQFLSNYLTDEEYYPANYTGYDYPIRPGTAEWEALPDHQAMVEACMIPEHILSTMTSEELAQTILAYPLLVDIFAYDDYDLGLEIVTKHFNGLTEFSKREDSASELANLYAENALNSINVDVVKMEADGSSASISRDDMLSKEYFRGMVLDVLLQNDTYSQKLTNDDVINLSKVASNRAQVINQNQMVEVEPMVVSGDTDIMTTESYTILYRVSAEIVFTDQKILSVTGGGVTLYTTEWRNIWMCSDGVKRYTLHEDMSEEEKTAINNEFYAVYKITPTAQPTIKYNCHSYAWYWQNPANPYWINDPSVYLLTRSEKDLEDVLVQNKVVYYESTDGSYENPTHSGVVIGITESSGNRNFTIRSKWGMSGLYEHDLSNCPYYYNEDNSSLVSDYGFYPG